MRSRKAIFFLVVFLCLLTLIIGQQTVKADRLESNSFVLQFGNFNTTSGEKSSASFNLTDTVGQTFSQGFVGTNYFVGAGFQHIYPFGKFAFSLSKTNIDLGELITNSHSTDSHTIEVSAKGAGGYRVYVYEQHPLQIPQTATIIPDTNCDNGLCTESLAQPWVNQNVPGFGFNISGQSVVADFIDSTYFRQFANQQASEIMQVIMDNPDVTNNDEATVTYKAGASGSQPAGNYETTVIYVAVPGY